MRPPGTNSSNWWKIVRFFTIIVRIVHVNCKRNDKHAGKQSVKNSICPVCDYRNHIDYIHFNNSFNYLISFCWPQPFLAETCKDKFVNLKNNYYKNLRNDTVGPEMRRRCAFLDDVCIDKSLFVPIWHSLTWTFFCINFMLWSKHRGTVSTKKQLVSHRVVQPNDLAWTTMSKYFKRIKCKIASCN